MTLGLGVFGGHRGSWGAGHAEIESPTEGAQQRLRSAELRGVLPPSLCLHVTLLATWSFLRGGE